MSDDDPPHVQDDAELARKARYEQRKRAYLSDNAGDGRPRVGEYGYDPLLEALMQGKR